MGKFVVTQHRYPQWLVVRFYEKDGSTASIVDRNSTEVVRSYEKDSSTLAAIVDRNYSSEEEIVRRFRYHLGLKNAELVAKACEEFLIKEALQNFSLEKHVVEVPVLPINKCTNPKSVL